MSIKDLTQKIQTASLNRTHRQRVQLLQKARIIDKNGYFSEDYFSEETVEKDRTSGKAVVA